MRLRGRDEHALAELASLYGHKIFQLAFRYMRNHEDAEEVVQDVLLKVFRKVEMFRGDSALSSWIYRITFNTAMSRLRRTKAARLHRGRLLLREKLADFAGGLQMHGGSTGVLQAFYSRSTYA